MNKGLKNMKLSTQILINMLLNALIIYVLITCDYPRETAIAFALVNGASEIFQIKSDYKIKKGVEELEVLIKDLKINFDVTLKDANKLSQLIKKL